MAAAAARQYTTATTFLADTHTRTVVVPSRYPSSSSSNNGANNGATCSQHAHTSSIALPDTANTRGFILARTVDDGYTLQLEYTALAASTSASNSSTTPFDALDAATASAASLNKPSPCPVKLSFPARLAPSPALLFVEQQDTHAALELQVYAVTDHGILYVLRFATNHLFYDDLDDSEDQTWCEEYKISHFANPQGLPVLMHAVQEAHVIVASSDGSAVSVVLPDRGGSLIETELRQASSFSVRSLIPFSSSRTAAGSPSRTGYPTSASASAPSQLVSLASMTGQDGVAAFSFGVSRDRKLKIWNLDTGVCLKSIDLPKPVSSSTALVPASSANDVDSTDSPTRPTRNGLLLPSSPQSFIKTFAGSDQSSFDSYLALIVPPSSSSPSACFIYGIVVEPSTRTVSELMPVCEKPCPDTSASLIDFQVEQLSLGPDQSEWTVWTVWDGAGESTLRYIGVPEIDGVDLTDVESSEEWTTINRGTTARTASWTPSYFDDLLDGNSASIPDVFMEHISRPGRYPAWALADALETYEHALEREMDDMSPPTALSDYFESAFDRIRAVVGCTIQLEQSPATGAYLHEAYNKRIKIEWLKFVAMLNQSRTDALYPIGISVSAQRRSVVVLHRQAMSAPIVQDTVMTLRDIETMDASDARRRRFMTGPPTFFEGCYPHLSERSVRSDAISILEAIRQLESSLTTAQQRSLDETLVSRIRSPFAYSVEDVALDLYAETLEPFVDDETAQQVDDLMRNLLTPEATFQTLWAMLTTSQVVASASADRQSSTLAVPSVLSSGLLADAVSLSIEARYTFARGLTTLLLFLCGEDVGILPELTSLTSSMFASLHTLATVRWIAQQRQAPTIDTVKDDDVLARFGEMNVSGRGDADWPRREDDEHCQILPSTSLLQGLIRSRYAPSLSTNDNFAVAATDGVSSFLSNLGLVSQKRLVVDTPADVTFALRLCQFGLSRLALEFVNMYPTGAGMLFVKGLAQVELGQLQDAQVSFAKAAPALYGDTARLDEDSGISHVLPVHVLGSLGRYYRHVTSIFVEHGADAAVTRFARLAIDTISEESAADKGVLQDLWMQLFKSNASLGEYEEAYSAMMTMPSGDTRNACLAHLISIMCESGNLNQLLSFSFVDVEADLERNLSFRARNSDPLATPNYYNVLYSYHVSRGDYRSAATAMFQQARRLGDMSTTTTTSNSSTVVGYRELATLQCQSYLAASNALSMVVTDNAWIAVIPTSEHDGRQQKKRRKIACVIPEEEFSDNAGAAPDVVDLADLRREYTIALSRLELSTEFPELERTNFSLDAEAVVALFSQTGAFDQAFAAARTLNVDMSSLFEVVAERCIALTLNPTASIDADWVTMNEEALSWEGSLASKAWRLLERYLTRHDTDGTNRGRLVVIERTIALNGGARLPSFLTEYMLDKDPDALVRTLLKHDRLDEAFKLSVALVKKQNGTTLASCALPFSLFDQLLAVKDTSSLSAEQLKSRQAELRQVLDARIGASAKASVAALSRR
ncbi:hypothetical protein ACM66B_000549 [Microbotryomycetes sp. NB124-2]